MQQKKRLEQFTCRVCGQECYSESRYVNHYQMVHSTKVIITRYQNKETGETRTKADYVIKTCNKDYEAVLQASGCNSSVQNEKSNVVDKSSIVQTEEVSTSEQNDKSDEMQVEQSPKEATKDTERSVVILVTPGSFTQQQSDSSVAENGKGSQETNEISENKASSSYFFLFSQHTPIFPIF